MLTEAVKGFSYLTSSLCTTHTQQMHTQHTHLMDNMHTGTLKIHTNVCNTHKIGLQYMQTETNTHVASDT